METSSSIALTFNDVLLKPGYSGFLRSEISLATQLTKRINLQAPLVSSPMDTVTESDLAIALAKFGGIGFIHRNLSIRKQAAEVKKVKSAGLLVGAAVGSSNGYEKRVAALIKAGADVLLVDSAHGYARTVIEAITYIKTHYDIDVIGGSVATAEGAAALIAAGVDGLRVGMGPGAICSTRIVSGMGVPQLTALFDVARVAKKHGVPVIADGGIIHSGDVVKALAAGASSVMMGRMFAMTTESPGKSIELRADEVPSRFRSIINGSASYMFKEYRGMGSLAAMKRGLEISSGDEFHGKSYTGSALIAEGVEGLVPCSGSLEALSSQIVGGVQSGFYYIGARTIPELWNVAQFIRITPESMNESYPHHLFITDTGGNLSA